MRRPAGIPLLILAAFSLLLPERVMACAVCGLDGDAAYYWSGLFLILMPFTVTAVIGGIIFRSLKKESLAPADETGQAAEAGRGPLNARS